MKRILSIDDEPGVLLCLKRALQKAGYEIVVTRDPDEGLRLLRGEPFDLLLLDIKMPRKDGFDVYRDIRNATKIPVIFVTAYPNSFCASSAELVDLWRNEFSRGDTDILYKPFTLVALYEKVDALIGKPREGIGGGDEPSRGHVSEPEDPPRPGPSLG